MNEKLPLVCVIGAGPCGIVAMKELKERGIPFEGFELGDRVGGLWIYENSNGRSCAYKSLHINTSKEKMQYSSFPMPDDYPDYPHHSLIADYFESFVDHFDLKPSIRFKTGVDKVDRSDDGLWKVTLTTGEVKFFDAVVVANGHHWNPSWPEPGFSGDFDGVEMHSFDYKTPTKPHDLRGKNVVVVGMGNSAMDIACELGARGQADKVFLSVRRGTYVLPKYFGSSTTDALVRHPAEKPSLIERSLPNGWYSRVLYPLLHLRTKMAVGNPEDFGLPKPSHKFGETHPTISNEIHTRLGSGDVLPKPNIKELRGHEVLFEDGTVEKVDAIIYATGYKITFPFFDEDVIDAKDNDVALYKRVLDPKYNNLFFVGLIQPLCSVMPIAELQSRWIANIMTGHYKLPSQREMAKEIRTMHADMKTRYVRSKRHTIQVECMEYSFDLQLEEEAGVKRARKEGQVPPIEAVAENLNHQQESREKSHAKRKVRGKARANKSPKPSRHPKRSPKSVSQAGL